MDDDAEDLSPEEQWEVLVTDKVYSKQYNLIKERFGKEAAEDANYGWGVSGDPKNLDIATKVYVEPGYVLSTKASFPSMDLRHEWSDY